MQLIRRRLTFANVVALLALFIALGGSAYAVHLGKNAVKTRNIRNGAVVESKLADRAVTKAKIAPGAVGTGSLGDIVERATTKPLPEGGTALVTATCIPGETLIGGSGTVDTSNSSDIVVTGVSPTRADGSTLPPGEAPTGWTVLANNYLGGTTTPAAASAYALCLK
jgi:hypothetical protein